MLLKKIKRLLTILACFALFSACDPSPDPTPNPPASTPKPDLSFGIMSDTHIGAPALSGLTPEARLVKAYQTFTSKNPALDAIVTVGDFSDDGTLESFNAYKEIMDEYSTAKHNLLAMGNHDNYDVTGDDAADRFYDVFGFEPDKDTEINGYHFITISTKDGVYNTETLAQHRTWLGERLAAANDEDPKKPIFVFHHHTMVSTKVIGHAQAEAKREYDLFDTLKEYPQVVAFSGHSHVSFVDPRNIWQGEYTAINCGSVLYTALDHTYDLTEGLTKNSAAGAAPLNRGESSTAMIVEVRGTKVTVRRFDMYWNVELPVKFEFDTSVNKANFPYREENRIAASSAPRFSNNASITINNLTENGFEYSFPQAINTSTSIQDDGAFGYDVGIKDVENDIVLFSDRLQANYFMIPRTPTIEYRVRKLQPETDYEIIITPIGYFGKEGTPLTKAFRTKDEGTGGSPADPIPLAALFAAVGMSALPPGTTMDDILGGVVGMTLTEIEDRFGGVSLFFKDIELTDPLLGTDEIDIDMTVYSAAFTLDDILALVS